MSTTPPLTGPPNPQSSTNDSTVVGYLQPTVFNVVGNDQSLRRFLQQVVAGVTGLPGNLVLPRWQPEPANRPAGDTPNLPGTGVTWAAVGVTNRIPDTYAYEGMFSRATIVTSTGGYGVGGYGTSPYGGAVETDTVDITVFRNEVLEITCSFYGPTCEQAAEVFFQGLAVAQNRELMLLNGFGLIDAKPGLAVPALIKGQWCYGVDVGFRVRRAVLWNYDVVTFLAAEFQLYTDPAMPTNGTLITVNGGGQG